MKGLLGERHGRSLRAIFLDSEITMVSCCFWRNRAPWRLAWRKCIDSFFLFPERGRVRVGLTGETKVIRPGEFLMLPEGIGHSLELVGAFRELRQFSIHCHIHDRWRRPLLGRFPSAFGALPAQGWMRRLRELTCLMETDQALAQEYGERMIRDLLAWQIGPGRELGLGKATGDSRVEVVVEKIRREFSSPALSVEDLARSVNITSVRLRTLFRRELGESPNHFLNSVRLQEAVRLLGHSTVSVKEVAAACGFSSDHYFHFMFRKGQGCTPGEYRQKVLREI